ncbi:MAG: hypothetical protein HQL54_01785 [Magnetococcales bacterium]|nr:hypothetical protein [Magnetococcales bacterium]
MSEGVSTPQPPAMIRLVLLLLLPVIAWIIWLDGQQLRPALLDFSRSKGENLQNLFPAELDTLPRMVQIRRYQSDTLYEYINGHAEFFLSAGFQQLIVGEYGRNAGEPALVIDLYDMGKPLHAFGVLMDEAGEQAQPVDIGSFGFQSGQGVNFVQGRWFIKLTAFESEDRLIERGRIVAKHIEQREPKAEKLEFGFPDLGEVLVTRYVKESYRGLDFLNGVLERTFETVFGKLVLFVMQDKEDKIESISKEILTFLINDGMTVSEQAFMVNEKRYTVQIIEDPYEGDWFFITMENRLIGGFRAWDSAMKMLLEKGLKNGHNPP